MLNEACYEITYPFPNWANVQVISSHNLLCMQLFICAGIKIQPC